MIFHKFSSDGKRIRVAAFNSDDCMILVVKKDSPAGKALGLLKDGIDPLDLYRSHEFFPEYVIDGDTGLIVYKNEGAE